MKTGVSMFSFSEHADLREIFPLIRQAGYDGVEPVMSEAGYLNASSTDQEIAAIGRLAREEGLEVPSVGVWSLWEHNLVSDSQTVREEALEIVKRQIHAAALLGADTILAVPGYVGCDFASKPERIPYDLAYKRCREAFRALAPFAEQAGVAIGIENVWNRFLLSPLEVKGLIREVGSPFFGAYFDVGNVMYCGYPEDWIRILEKDIKKIHLSDYRVSQAGLGAFVDLFAGDVDFSETAKSLAEIGYDDYLTLEMLPNYKQFPEVSLRSNRPAVEKIVCLVEEEKKKLRKQA